MFRVTDDLRIRELRPLISPAILEEELPVTERVSAVVSEAREAAEGIIAGRDDRLLVVTGPCSIHDVTAALEYGRRLAEVAERLRGELLVLMRVYFEKPRTTVGWKGLINDPDLDGSFAINRGLRVARKLLLDLAELGVPAGHEFLDTITPQFIADAVAWGAIGARTTESQVHRQLASGLSCPVGFKNGTHGSVQIAVDAVRAASQPHHFMGVTKQGLSAIVSTRGNAACHIILRGSTAGPNYGPGDVEATAGLLAKAKRPPYVMIDCSHGNSGKDYRRQGEVAAAVGEQLRAGSRALMGVMLESHLVGGRQDYRAGASLTFGQSITDACVGWDETVPLLEGLAEAVRARRGAGVAAGAAAGVTG
jgi:3-deoxy-7-phosphoheptulonate synthase